MSIAGARPGGCGRSISAPSIALMRRSIVCLVATMLVSARPAAAHRVASPAPCQKATFKVALDIGHDKVWPGATSGRGLTEFSYNLALGQLARSALKAAGFTQTFLINEDGAKIPLSRRPDIAREQGASIFISLHHDSVQPQYLSQWIFEGASRSYSDKFRGYGVFVSASSHWARASLSLAEDLGRSLEAQGLRPSMHHAEPIPGENRVLLNPTLGIYRFDELAVLRGATTPALLLEAGVIVNRDEEKAIQTGLYRPKIAAALVEAITRFCSTR